METQTEPTEAAEVPTQTEPEAATATEEGATQTAEEPPALAGLATSTDEQRTGGDSAAGQEPAPAPAATVSADGNKPMSTMSKLKLERDQLAAASAKQIATIEKLQEQAGADARTIEKLAAQIQKLSSELMDGHGAEEGVPPKDGESSEDEMDEFDGERQRPELAGLSCVGQCASLKLLL